MAESAGKRTVVGVARRRVRVAAGTAAVSAALIIGGCGSTAPNPSSAPSPVLAPAPQYPSLVGEWGGSGGLSIQYRDSNTVSYHCDASASVRSQHEATFTGYGSLNGSSLNSDKQCPGSFAFTAVMTPDGTITSVQTDGPFRLTDCMAVTDVSFSNGTASSTGFSIRLTDHALCRWPPLDPRNPYSKESDRSFTMVVDRWRGPGLPQ